MNPLQQLQEDAVALLLGNPDTAAVPYTSFRKQVIDSVQNEAEAAWQVRVDGMVGAACLVLMPSVTAKYPNVPGPQYEIELIVRTFEDPKVNNTGLSAEQVAVWNLRWLDGVIIEDLTQLFADVKGPALRPNYDYPGFLVYDTTMMGQLPQDLVERTPPPTIDEAGGVVTLGCTDGAAAIYYTLDGTMPQPGSAGALYAAPFAVADGAVVRCVAWRTPLLPSDVAKGTIHL